MPADADAVPGDACADGVFALDVTARRHHEIPGEQGHGFLSRSARAPSGRRPCPRGTARRDGQPSTIPGGRRGRGSVRLKRPRRSRHSAKPLRTSNWLRLVVSPGSCTRRCAVLWRDRDRDRRSDLLAADQLGNLIARLDTAGPAIGVLVDAELVDGGDIDAVEPVGEVAKLKRAAIPDDGGGGRTLAGRKYDREQRRNQKNS